jgi:5'-3' exonuclease
MGIDGFHKWIDKSYPNAYININNDNIFHHMYIDLNYLLHLCHYNSNDEVHLLNKMGITILDMCMKIQPCISLNLFCDGTAPFAKMVLQRERRCKNIKTDEDIFKTSLNFTPGTKFIKEISTKLEKYIKIIKSQFNINVNIDSIAPGEAEIKIKNKLLKYYNNNKNHNHLLITNDADVVLILSSDESYKKTNIMINNKILSIEKLMYEHFKIYNNKLINTYHNLDFVFLSLLLGNDYIPKISEISPIKIWDSYKLNINKHEYLIKKENNKFDINKQFLIDILNDCIGKIGKNKIKKNYYLFNREIYSNYFEGILWTIDMYKSGRCKNYNYICNYQRPINILDFVLYIDSLENINKYNFIEAEPIPSILCGILLLPKNANELIDEKYKKFMDDIKEIYDSNFKISITFINDILKKYREYENTL